MNRATRTFLRAWIALALVLATSCATPRHLRDAQSAFNDAAQAENAEQFTSGAGAVATGGSAVAGYRVALGLLDVELADHQAELRQENLLGTALMLRVLCLWRIADLEVAADPGAAVPAGDPRVALREQLDLAIGDLRTRKADPQSGVTLGPRDDALLAALPGLIDHDAGLRQGSYAKAKSYFASAMAVYDSVLQRATLPSNHPLRLHLLLSKLATIRAWKFAASEARIASEEVPPEDRLSRDQYLEVEDSLSDQFDATVKQLGPAATGDPALSKLVGQYAAAFGKTWPPR
jgi:hypothetical protein